jgi:hypothetical protein
MPDDEHRIRVALELNALHAAGAFGNSLEGAHIGTGTPIFDLNGTNLYERIPLTGENLAGYADVAVDPAMGAVLMVVNLGFEWKERSLLAQAERALRKRLAPGAREPDSHRFVAYSYPKLAVQFCAGDEELALLELGSWRQVPPARERAPNEMPSFFDRWSYLDNHPLPERLSVKRQSFEARVREIESIPGRHLLALDRIARGQFADVIEMGGGGGKGGGGDSNGNDGGGAGNG